jgi:hypothetical protein
VEPLLYFDLAGEKRMEFIYGREINEGEYYERESKNRAKRTTLNRAGGLPMVITLFSISPMTPGRGTIKAGP